MSADTIKHYETLCAGIDNYIENYSKWHIFRINDIICLYVINFDDIPKIDVSITVQKDLNVQVYKAGLGLINCTLNWVQGQSNKLAYWS